MLAMAVQPVWIHLRYVAIWLQGIAKHGCHLLLYCRQARRLDAFFPIVNGILYVFLLKRGPFCSSHRIAAVHKGPSQMAA